MKALAAITFILLTLKNCRCEYKFSFVLDARLQDFRREVSTFQTESLIRLDQSFFQFYNFLFQTLNNSISKPFAEMDEAFNASCSGFPMFTLEEMAARRLVNICDEVKRFLQKRDSFVDEIMSQYYPEPETLSHPTLMELMAEDYFESMKKHLENVIPVYNQNVDCSEAYLKTFLRLYKKPIEKMVKINHDLVWMFKKATRRDFSLFGRAVSMLFGVTNRMTMCSNKTQIDTYGCIEGFVGYNCKKHKSGCGPVYKSIFQLSSKIRHIQGFHERHYQQAIGSLFDTMQQAEANLVLWSDQLDGCLIEQNEENKVGNL